jgi:DNA-binding transcriptional ArsR family regulator
MIGPMPSTTTPREKIPHPPKNALDLANVMRTLGDPVRLEMVRILAEGGPRSCGDLADAVGLPISTGSYHMRLLREAGLTRTRAEGTHRVVSLRRDDLDERFPGLVEVLTR